jgi:glycerol-3-phosphate dehydrogenase
MLFRKAIPPGRFSHRTRAAYLDRFQRETFDLVVVGGGINGAGIARDAAFRGLSVALLEKGDFGSGTSSRSSRMIHGGLRYLRYLHVRLVREALREREVLLKTAPHLVQPFPFVLTVYGGGAGGRLQLKLGLMGYDLLAGSQRVGHHEMLSRQETLRLEPTLRRDGLQGAFRFFECLVDDARLTLANVRSAAQNGAVAVNYAEVIELLREDGTVQGVRFRDRLSGATGVVRGRVVVNAAGPWLDRVRAMSDTPPILRPTKGIHLVVPRGKLNVSTIIAFITSDRRDVFAVPAGDWTYVGTTDTDFSDDPDTVRTDAADVQYLLDAVNSTFDDTHLSASDVVATWAGIRPLVSEEGAPSAVSRDYEIRAEPQGLVTIAGGKLTTYRAMAEDLVDQVIDLEGKRSGWSPGPCRTADVPLPGGDLEGFDRYHGGATATLEESWSLAPVAASRLVRTYGTEHVRLLAYGLHDRRLLEPLGPDCSVLRAQAAFAAAEEMALTLDDFMARRTDLMLFDHNHGLDVAAEAAQEMGRVLGWSRRERQEQVERYRQTAAAMLAFARKEEPTAAAASP